MNLEIIPRPLRILYMAVMCCRLFDDSIFVAFLAARLCAIGWSNVCFAIKAARLCAIGWSNVCFAIKTARLCAIRARGFCAMSRSTCASDRAVFDGSSDTFDEPESVDGGRA